MPLQSTRRWPPTYWLGLAIIWMVMMAVGAQNQCTKEGVELCLAPMNEYQEDILQAVVPTMTTEQMREHCRRYDQFAQCLAPMKSTCSKVDRLVYEGIDDAYQFMCHDGFDEYQKHIECFKNQDLHVEGNVCNETLDKQLRQLGYYTSVNNKSLTYQRDRICQYVEQYLGCVEAAVRSFCDQAAATWQRTLDQKSLMPILDRINCPGYEYGDQAAQTSTWIYIVVGILLVISVIIIVVTVVLIVRARKRKRPRRAEDMPSQVVPPSGAPPAYDSPYVTYTPDGHAQVQHPSGGAQAGGVDNQAAGPLPEKTAEPQPPPYDPVYNPPVPPSAALGSDSVYTPLEYGVGGGQAGAMASPGPGDDDSDGVKDLNYFGVSDPEADLENSSNMRRSAEDDKVPIV